MTNMLEVVRQMDSTRRFVGGATLLIAVIAMWLLVQWAVSPVLVPLYSQRMSMSEMSSIGAQLQSMGYRFEYGPGGDELLVPASQLQAIRVELAGQQVGVSGCGELTEFPLGAGSIQQQLVQRRSLQDHLACTIGKMDGIERAVVHLALPDPTPFRRLQNPAKASVVVWPKRGTPLDRNVVRSITLVLTGAVENLAVEQVSVVNARGNTMVAAAMAGGGGGSTHELEVREQVEQHLTRKAEQLLATIMNPGEYQVQISTTLDFTRVERTSEQFDPEAQAIIREGATEFPPGANGAGSPAYNSEERESRYSRTLENFTNAPGEIVRMSVAVLVDERAEMFGGAAPAGQLQQIEQVVRNAVGIDNTRGDDLVVAALPFTTLVDSLVAADTAGGIDPFMLIERLSRPAVGLLGIIVTLIIALRTLKMIRTAQTSAPRRLSGAASPGEAYPSEEEYRATVPPKLDARQRLANDVARDTERDPETAARVVRAWLQESPS